MSRKNATKTPTVADEEKITLMISLNCIYVTIYKLIKIRDFLELRLRLELDIYVPIWHGYGLVRVL